MSGYFTASYYSATVFYIETFSPRKTVEVSGITAVFAGSRFINHCNIAGFAATQHFVFSDLC